MADEQKSEQKQEQKAPKLQAAPKGTSVPQEALQSRKGEPELAFAGDNKAKVNPDLNSVGVTLPTGLDDDGQMQADNFQSGRVYYVNDEALEKKNAEGLNLLVASE